MTVRETTNGVYLRQDRFLLTGKEPEDTTWCALRITFNFSLTSGRVIPLHILSADAAGHISIDHEVLLREQEQFIALDTSRPFKINAGTTGYCEFLPAINFHRSPTLKFLSADRVLYSPDRLKAIGVEAAKETSAFSLQDRVGLIHDAIALAKGDLMKISNALDLVHAFRSEKECK